METAFIELGSYSVKLLRGVVERKTVQYLSFHEKTLRETLLKLDQSGEIDRTDEIPWDIIEAVQFQFIEEYLQEYPSLEKVIIKLPSYYSTLRLFTLPIKNRKKVEQMIPFQLEEELPYSSANTHLALFPMMTTEGSYTITLATNIEQFDSFFQRTQDLARPTLAIIGTESIYQTLVSEYGLSGSIAIVDFGHSKSTCYLFNDKRLTGVEFSFVCGRITDEVIAETYQISTKEAISFKHKNSFFLTDTQAENVDEDQKEFSLLMKKTFSNFIDDFKRWNVSHQLRTRQPIHEVLITGGMSNIKNIDYFLTQNLGVPVSHLNHLQETRLADLALSPPQLKSLTTCHGLSYHVTTKNGLSNFCNGNYAMQSDSELPLESISFLGVRMAIVCAILLIALIFENIHLSRLDRKFTLKITDQLKNPLFEITPSQRRRLLRDPDHLLSSLEQKNKRIDDQRSVLEEIVQIDGINPLKQLSTDINNSHDVELVSFSNQDKNIRAQFKAKGPEVLKSLEQTLRGKNYNEMKIDFAEEGKRLELSYHVK